ncbi:unnamed protein product [Cylindrotheca closterium]|uniref:Uncharacterized protein n=1 Tax=Cylindrotheca closterium TaxID=2856 RepID=A0AAD2FCB9_9STRA|nr:unnamed protein product [Cylindrotheca closterium]
MEIRTNENSSQFRRIVRLLLLLVFCLLKISVMHFFKVLLLMTLLAVVSARERMRSSEQNLGPKHTAGIKQVKEHHERRMTKLEEMIEERRQMVEDHERGHRKLSQEEYERASRQHGNFQQKLEQMRKTNHHEAHMDRMHEMKELHERSMRIKEDL